LIIDAAAEAVAKLQSLPAGHKETFAFGFIDLTTKLHSRTDEFLASRSVMPAEMPDPLPQPNVLFKANRKRGYTGTEAAEEDEKDARRARRRAERDAEARRRENEARSQELLEGRTAYEEQEEDRRREYMQIYAATVMERRRQQGLVTPVALIESIDHLATSSSDELSDPPITQVTENETSNESESDGDSDDDDEVIPSTHSTEAGPFIQVPATVPTSIRSSTRSKRHIRKFESQYARDIVVMEAKEERRKQREAKANRTGTGRTKAAETLAQTSQLLDGVELPFRSSQ
jgi:hypothetical protein